MDFKEELYHQKALAHLPVCRLLLLLYSFPFCLLGFHGGSPGEDVELVGEDERTFNGALWC